MWFHLAAFSIGFAADLLLGDPLGNFHIVIAMGKLIALSESAFRDVFPQKER